MKVERYSQIGIKISQSLQISELMPWKYTLRFQIIRYLTLMICLKNFEIIRVNDIGRSFDAELLRHESNVNTFQHSGKLLVFNNNLHNLGSTCV